eukprot:9490643-Pyramimonas_sp.AAC.1
MDRIGRNRQPSREEVEICGTRHASNSASVERSESTPESEVGSNGSRKSSKSRSTSPGENR